MKHIKYTTQLEYVILNAGSLISVRAQLIIWVFWKFSQIIWGLEKMPWHGHPRHQSQGVYSMGRYYVNSRTVNFSHKTMLLLGDKHLLFGNVIITCKIISKFETCSFDLLENVATHWLVEELGSSCIWFVQCQCQLSL